MRKQKPGTYIQLKRDVLLRKHVSAINREHKQAVWGQHGFTHSDIQASHVCAAFVFCNDVGGKQRPHCLRSGKKSYYLPKAMSGTEQMLKKLLWSDDV
ncbi:hypothetical protein ILYODFUR_010635 [Ilyodon furcidens]|uniref:Uncharacterized protein n=1 Tax=Ilyodon furcidens TaxID=33524 RepID=A0ABV0TUP4_9TELE